MALGKCRLLGPSCASKGGSSTQLHRCDDCGAVGCWNCIACKCKSCGSHKGHHSPVR
jgi:hypothetical protein